MAWEVEFSDEFGKWWDSLTGNDRWYEDFVPVADSIYDRHLQGLG
jgi:hypothetical protein